MAVKRIDIEGLFGSVSQNQRFEQLFGFTPFPYEPGVEVKFCLYGRLVKEAIVLEGLVPPELVTQIQE